MSPTRPPVYDGIRRGARASARQCHVSRKDARPSACKRGYGRNHQRLQRIILSRDPVCRKCNREQSTIMHHVDGDPHNLAMDNLMGVCQACHNRETAQQKKAGLL